MVPVKPQEQPPRRSGQTWPRQSPPWLRYLSVYVCLFVALLALRQVSFLATQISLEMTISPHSGTFAIDGTQLVVPWQQPSQMLFVTPPALTREFQLDGSDGINNATEDSAYLSQVASSPYYQFQAWLRDFPSYSSWRQVVVRDANSGAILSRQSALDGSASVALRPGGSVAATVSIARLEVPLQIVFLCQGVPCAQLVIDRNDRYVIAQTFRPSGLVDVRQQAFFPMQPIPFAAEIVYLLANVVLWSLVLLGLLSAAHMALMALVLRGAALRIPSRRAPLLARDRAPRPALTRLTRNIQGFQLPSRPRSGAPVPRTLTLASFQRLPGDRWDALALLMVLGSLGFTLFVAIVQYHAEPHILDASAYYFQAKIFASGRLAAPAPANLDAFQGPFMVAYDGRWFSQYPPMTSALLAIGLLLRAPWLIEPLLGSLALWGIYRLGRRIFSPAVGLLAVVLGALSPFYTYLAASYLSHTIALFFTVYFLLLLLRFRESHHARDILCAAVCIGALLLTRELSAIIMGFGVTIALGVRDWRTLWTDRWRVVPALLMAASLIGFALCAYFAYDMLQTGNPLTSPRYLFSPADTYGFGPGVGFYGEHTLAAGLVNLDQLLTILLIDLYGWPFYLTLAFVPLAFVGRASTHYWEGFCLALALILMLAQVGYFYHGIYLGPRYLFETLPFLLLLTARGITTLPTSLVYVSRRLIGLIGLIGAQNVAWQRRAASLCAGGIVLLLISCNLIYYLPRQLQLHANFTGLPASEPVDVAAIYRFHPANAIVTSGDPQIYNNVLWPLNMPDLNSATLYAYAPSTAARAALHLQYPGRAIYILRVDATGHVSFDSASSSP